MVERIVESHRLARKALEAEWKRHSSKIQPSPPPPFRPKAALGARISRALSEALENSDNLKAVLFLSDGDSNTGPRFSPLPENADRQAFPYANIQISSAQVARPFARYAPSFALQNENNGKLQNNEHLRAASKKHPQAFRQRTARFPKPF